MYDNKRVTNDKMRDLKRVNGIYPDEARKEFVRIYRQSLPISKEEFCRQYGIDDDSLRRWLRLYDDTTPAGECPENHPASKAALYESSASVTIPYAEYQELHQIKAKYHAICSLCS